MKCPIDNADLQMMERQNVEIDYCPKCRGVWLDRGELDKIIERSEKEMGTNTIFPSDQVPPQYPQYGEHGYRKYERKSLLRELFD